jgi:hypothetical protein
LLEQRHDFEVSLKVLWVYAILSNCRDHHEIAAMEVGPDAP